ncbi:WG repeat-containing protein [Flavobacterium rhamnosiphilum]|uniref:WG repeat-containing protein n=1 Tax=Flavobacterium rhamnosiphilum TaxID=2541724 RepID=A0A4R5F9W2_9FLAO|nr:WG repeat-containing protein [Flavobacterium rhamnosiphilum]TDE45044.1 WG repeat-containing protein [Flavobacterium rhamnosiphilum]
MKKKFSFLFILLYSFCFSQTEKLFYYIEKDSLLGVKNQNGKIIVPADVTWSTIAYNDTAEIKSNIFLLSLKNKGDLYFDRKGHFLFETALAALGYSDFHEGYILYEEGRKSGLANRLGNKIIPAQYDYISPMNFGFAEYCNGCYRDTSEDEEHAPLVGGVWGFVDRNGEEIKTTSKRNHPKDIETKEHTFIPYQFRYNKKEQKILAFFEKRKNQIIKINGLNCSDQTLFFEIVEKPSEFNPFYKIKTYELCDKFPNGADETYSDFKNFKVSDDGKNYYVIYTDLVNHEKYSEYIERKILVDDWIKSNQK